MFLAKIGLTVIILAWQSKAHAIHVELDLDVVDISNGPKGGNDKDFESGKKFGNQHQGPEQAEIVLGGGDNIFPAKIVCRDGAQPSCSGGLIHGYCMDLCECKRGGDFKCTPNEYCSLDQIIAGCITNGACTCT